MSLRAGCQWIVEALLRVHSIGLGLPLACLPQDTQDSLSNSLVTRNFGMTRCPQCQPPFYQAIAWVHFPCSRWDTP